MFIVFVSIGFFFANKENEEIFYTVHLYAEFIKF